MLRSSHHLLLVAFFLMVLNSPIQAKMLHVPQDYATIQIAIRAAAIGDTVIVSAGTYNERIKLKPGITVRSEGDNTKGAMGTKRAEATIINRQGNNGQPLTPPKPLSTKTYARIRIKGMASIRQKQPNGSH